MKFLIWFLCILAYGIFQTVLSGAGITLGAIPTVLLFAGVSALARALCKNWDERQTRKASQKYEKDLAASGLSRFEFAQSRMTATSREFCDKHIQEPKVLEKYFNQLIGSGTITHEESRVLLHGYERLAKEAAAAEKEKSV